MDMAVMQDDPGGFKLLVGTLSGVDGEAYIETPDGAICHVTWIRPEELHFEAVPVTTGADSASDLTMSEADDLDQRFPDLSLAADAHRDVEPELLDAALPDLKRQWETWKAAQED
ncbi:MAG: hypothetical protein ABSF84_15375 [Acidimicrobiales bacterium]|jgi:hypothetical protein